MRKSLKSQRKKGDYEQCEKEISTLKKQEEAQEVEVWFSDETSVQLNPNSHYAWHAPQQILTLPAKRTKVSNILGFIRRNNESEFYEFEGNIDSELWIKSVENFIDIRNQINPNTKKVIVIDCSSVHKAKIVKEKFEEWEKKNIFIHYLKPYCSELNPIETVWRFLKHKWIAVSDYISKEKLAEKVLNILENFGKEYNIQFQ